MNDHPLFAVVGHPNKGKSSVVAALTQDDQVAISPLSGTTRHSQHFRLKMNDTIALELIDTPGFQRAEECLSWLQEDTPALHLRPERVRAFVETFAGSGRFEDEVELLGPIVEGAGIIYVVDGSLPYSPEYETEMEILRWTAQPRLALINPIGGDQFLNQWQNALNQYFSLVRVFNPFTAGFDQHLQVLRAFAELESNPQRLDPLIEALRQQREQLLQQAAQLIVERLAQLLHHRIKRPALLDAAFDGEEAFNRSLNLIELESQKQLESLFLHHHLSNEQARLQLLPGQLMDQQYWSLWGLDQQRLALVAAAAGASLGLGADLMVGGHSLLLGSIGGGIAGGLSGWYGSDWARKKLPAWVKPQEQKQLGPVKDVNFGFVALGRALQHAEAMLQHSHADHRPLQWPSSSVLQQLPKKEQIRFLKWFYQLRKEGLNASSSDNLQNWIYQHLSRFNK